MSDLISLTAENCSGFEPRMFAVNHAGGEKLSPEVRPLLDTVDTDSFHCWMISKDTSTELHYHDHDEYWAWARGRSMLTLRLPDGRREEFEIGPGWIVYCLRGVEHGHKPLEDWGCFEWVSILRPGAKSGHLFRG
ncbi:MAG: hypothetical protein QF662_05495 [Phycisphaerae bacterium]|jgi:mannose-6-phosphate isomerase-like protein (cupin superfamily)|nr:hypothetical protein [Phycisphaerae bacterium]